MKPSDGYVCNFCQATVLKDAETGQPHHSVVTEDDGESLFVVFACPECWVSNPSIKETVEEYEQWVREKR